MSNNQQEKDIGEIDEKIFTNREGSRESDVSRIRCAVCKREFTSMPSYYDHIPCLDN